MKRNMIAFHNYEGGRCSKQSRLIFRVEACFGEQINRLARVAASYIRRKETERERKREKERERERERQEREKEPIDF